jgi:hypothetical protein
MDIQKLFNEEIAAELEVLENIDMTSDKYEQAVNGLSKLTDKAIEMEKLNIEREKIEKEIEIKLQQMEEDKKDRKVRNWLTGAGIVIPAGVTIWGAIYTIAKEEGVVISSIMGRGFIQNIQKLLFKK